jgi:hypothetical protein
MYVEYKTEKWPKSFGGSFLMDRQKAIAALIDFMYYKKSQIPFENNYFDEKDEENLRLLSDDKLWYVITSIIGLIRDHSDYEYVVNDIDLCPFCLLYASFSGVPLRTDCKSCSYKKNHGNCGLTGSDYESIIKKLEEEEDKSSISHLFGKKEFTELSRILENALKVILYQKLSSFSLHLVDRPKIVIQDL